MTPFQLVGDLAHLASLWMLVHKMYTTGSCRGLSLKTQALYLIAFTTRYLDVFVYWISVYNLTVKVVFVASSCCVVCLIRTKYWSTYDFSADTFPIQYLLSAAALLAYKVNYAPTVLEFFWSFAIYLEAVAFLPQRALLQRSRSGPGDTVDAYYLAALVAYRAFYIANWVQRYLTQHHKDPIATAGGLVALGIYLNSSYIYFTRPVQSESVSESIFESVKESVFESDKESDKALV